MLGLAETTATLIENARWIDSTQGMDRVGRILIHHGVIAALDPNEGDLPAE
jgi:hypothetical protein